MASEFAVPALPGMDAAASAMGYGSLLNWMVAKGFARPNGKGGVDTFKSALTASQPQFPYKAVFLAFAADLQTKQVPVPPAFLAWLQQSGFGNMFQSSSDPSDIVVAPSSPSGGSMQSSNAPAQVNNAPRGIARGEPSPSGLSLPVKIGIGALILGGIGIATSKKARAALGL